MQPARRAGLDRLPELVARTSTKAIADTTAAASTVGRVIISSLDLDGAAVHEQFNPRDEAGVVG